MPELSLKEIFALIHVLGVIIGMGSALLTDYIFLHSVRDQRLSEKELEIIKLSSRSVWIGLSLIIASGLALFSLNPEVYSQSAKFLAKMTIVAIVAINGAIFHFSHIPRMLRSKDLYLPNSEDFKKGKTALVLSGAVSSVSWFSAFVLGSIRKVPASYAEIIGLYLCVLLFALITASFLKNVIFKSK